MNVKNCTACGFKITTKNAVKTARRDYILFFNCPKCDGTVILRLKNWKELMLKELGLAA